jgi:hypothetical protein
MRFVGFLAALLFALPAHAATLRAAPNTFKGVLAGAKAGDTVVLARGSYGDVMLPARDHAKPVSIDARAAVVRSLTIRGTAGWRWTGGTVDSPPLQPPHGAHTVWRNVMIDSAHRIELAGVTLTGGHTGVLVTRGSSDIVLRDNIATGLQSDGFNIATATRVSLLGNTCRDFRPIPPVYDGARMVKDGTHPDCIMLWSETGRPPTSDITIIGNRAEGAMQGIAHFWHPRLGRDKVYRVTARDNIVEVSYFHGIMLENTPGSDIRNNVVRTIKGATAAGRPSLRVKAWLRSDKEARRCGNTVDGVAEPRCGKTS